MSWQLPSEATDPSAERLIEEGPIRHQRFLDWGLFHVELAFLVQWQDLQRVRRQRNAAERQTAHDAERDA